jgi:hypothetical protein
MQLDPDNRYSHLQNKSQAYPERTYSTKRPIKTVRNQDKLISAVVKQRYEQDVKEWERDRSQLEFQYLPRPAPKYPSEEALRKHIDSIFELMCPNCWQYVTENLNPLY